MSETSLPGVARAGALAPPGYPPVPLTRRCRRARERPRFNKRNGRLRLAKAGQAANLGWLTPRGKAQARP
jgi:hypothetical protein